MMFALVGLLVLSALVGLCEILNAANYKNLMRLLQMVRDSQRRLYRMNIALEKRIEALEQDVREYALE